MACRYQILIKPLVGSSILLQLSDDDLGRFLDFLELERNPLFPGCRFLNSCGREINEDYLKTGSQHPCTILVSGRLLGGKGGFGANLRRQGGRMRAKKTTNFDSCRDLNGRRLKTIKKTQHMADYIAHAEERRREGEEALRRKIIAGLQGPSRKNQIEDPNYVSESKKIVEATLESVEEGISITKTRLNGKSHEKKDQDLDTKTKKQRLTFWEDVDGFVDNEELENESNEEMGSSVSTSSSIKVSS